MNTLTLHAKRLKNYTTLLALIATILIWSSAFVAIRIGVREYHPGSFALLRLGIAAIGMAILYLLKPPRQRIGKKYVGFALLLGVVGMSVYHTCLNKGEQTVTAGIASFIIAQIPVIITLIAVVFLKEKVHKRGWLGLTISIVGVFVIAIGEIEHAQIDMGVVYILIATISASIYTINAKSLLKQIKSLYLTVYVIIGGAIGTLIFLPQLVHDVQTASAQATLAGVYLGVFPTMIAYITYNYALSKIPASTAASWLYTMPIVTILMSWTWLGELPTLLAFAGGLLALLGTILVNISSAKKTE